MGGVRGTISGLLEQYGLPREWLPYSSELDTPYPESSEVLAELVTRYKLGIIANQELGSEKRLDKFGLLKYFDIIVASAEVGVSKPDQQIFQIAIERSGTAPGEIVMIGDRPDNDIYPAKRLGMCTIRVKQGYNSYQAPQSDDHIADITVNGLRELLDVL
jgi:FMN phosphatase YigB (HAD superfamily)